MTEINYIKLLKNKPGLAEINWAQMTQDQAKIILERAESSGGSLKQMYDEIIAEKMKEGDKMTEIQIKAQISKAPEYGCGKSDLVIEVTDVILPEGMGDDRDIIVSNEQGLLVDKSGLTDLLLGERTLKPLCKADGMLPFQMGDRLNLYGKPYHLAKNPAEASLIEKIDENGTVLARYHWYN